MGLPLDVRAQRGIAGIAIGRGISVVTTLLIALAAGSVVAGITAAALRPDAVRVAAVALALAWMAPAVGYRRAGRLQPAAATGLIALAHAGASAWFAATPITIAVWLMFSLALPDLHLGTVVRRVMAVSAGVGAVGWTGWLVATGQTPSTPGLIAATVSAVGVGLVGLVVRSQRASTEQRQLIQWLAAAAVIIVAGSSVLLVLHGLLGVPAQPAPWVMGSLVLVPLGLLAGLLPGIATAGARVLGEAIVVAGVAVFGVVGYLVVVVGLVRVPVDAERDILLASVAATLLISVLTLPLRARLIGMGRSIASRAERSAIDVVGSFNARMSRAVPLDELLLQLAESLHATISVAGAEVWTGTDGVLTRTVSVPHHPSRQLVLSEPERIVVGRTRIGGASWSSMWLPELVSDGQYPNGQRPDRRRRDDHAPEDLLRVAPAAHLGELLGLVVVRRPPGSVAFSAEEDATLVELARQVGLALHNDRLDAALRVSLVELQQRNAELQASRLRIVTAADESRRRIERDLHDGAQQHLVALAVKLGLARQLVDSDPSIATAQLEEFRADVQTTIEVVRELAHGIYPPLLRQQGLAAALRTAAARSPLPCAVTVALPGRYPVEVETAVYFCCLEAIHNAGKHAGQDASITVHVDHDGPRLRFTVSDDGVGFDTGPDGVGTGHGFINMQDRVGALGGSLEITSAPDRGTTVRGVIPAAPLGAGQ